VGWRGFDLNRDGSGLSYGKGCIWSQEFMAEDLGEEDIVGLVFGFELVATDGAVGGSEVARFTMEIDSLHL
jgi:hypothetical protein